MADEIFTRVELVSFQTLGKITSFPAERHHRTALCYTSVSVGDLKGATTMRARAKRVNKGLKWMTALEGYCFHRSP